MPQLTKHAVSRMKERCGVTKANAPKVARRAYRTGITHANTRGELHRYLDSIYLSQKKGTNMRVFGNAVYVFKRDVLITVIRIPDNILREAKTI